MQSSLTKCAIKTYLFEQLSHFCPWGEKQVKSEIGKGTISDAIDLSFFRIEKCFSKLVNPQYSDDDGNAIFYHLNADHYAYFLYFFMNSLWVNSQNKEVCDRVMYLNRSLNGFFVSYKCELPDVFFLGHPVGTVLGNASYSDYLVVTQNVTINSGAVLGKGLYMAAGSTIIGNQPIGDLVTIGANTCVHKTAIPSKKFVYSNEYGKLIVKDNIYMRQQDFFRDKLE